jgi:hypothetical protein
VIFSVFSASDILPPSSHHPMGWSSPGNGPFTA